MAGSACKARIRGAISPDKMEAQLRPENAGYGATAEPLPIINHNMFSDV